MNDDSKALEAALTAVAQAADEAATGLSRQPAYEDDDRIQRDAAVDALDALCNVLRAMIAARPQQEVG